MLMDCGNVAKNDGLFPIRNMLIGLIIIHLCGQIETLTWENKKKLKTNKYYFVAKIFLHFCQNFFHMLTGQVQRELDNLYPELIIS